MARRASDNPIIVLQNLFTRTPWWACPVTAAVAYVVLAYILPSMFRTHPLLSGLAAIAPLLAAYVVAIIFLGGAAAWLSKWMNSRLLDRQSGKDSINDLTWQQFEQLIGAAYRRQGYSVIGTSSGADGGIDLILHRNGEKTLVQCKHWRARTVGVKIIRELHGLTHSKEHAGSRGTCITFGNYTREAKVFAHDNDIELIDHRSLLKIIRATQRSPHL